MKIYLRMVHRHFWLRLLKQGWSDRSVAWLAGVRRAGKTCLCQSLPDIEYFDGELPRLRRLMLDPQSFLDSLRGKRIVLDEIHRLQNPSELLKIAADHYPRTHVVAKGSSTLGASKKFRETLAGRKRDLWLQDIAVSIQDSIMVAWSRAWIRKAMATTILALALSFLSLAAVGQQLFIPPSSNRVDLSLNDSWRFHRGDVTGAEGVDFDDSGWDSISTPHTWNNFDGQDGSNYYRGVGWYRTHYTIDASYAGRNFYLQCDGSNIVTDVYVNGGFVGEHKGGFAAFRFDITPNLAIGGDNVIAIKVNNARNLDVPPLDADFTFFGGLYRNVHLLITDRLQVQALDYGSSGIYLRPSNITPASADLQVTAKVWNGYSDAKNVVLNSVVVDAENNIVATLTSWATIDPNSEFDFVQNTTLSQPHLWNGLADPYLYTVFVEVLDVRGAPDGSVNDLVSQPLGFRTFSVDPDNGFFLNGSYLDLHGVNRHQDRLNMGWAITQREHDEDFALIKEMGASVIRTSHYQHDQYFYSLGDKNGIVMWAELPLINHITDSQAFYDNAAQQLTELIRQNYNHPSIIFWSIANEIRLQSGPDPNPLLEQLGALVASEDASRLSTLASCCVSEGDQSTNHTDVVGFNEYFGWYGGSYNDFAPWADRVHRDYPQKRFGVSEYGAGSSIYFHSDNPVRMDHTEEYQNVFHEVHWKAMKDRPFLWGKFVWNMFDFASASRNEGDTRGRNDKGLVTYDRQTRKDAFYWYKANWSSDPVVYISSRRFTPRSNPVITVKVYSNTDSVELFLNGTSLGNRTSKDRRFIWDSVNLRPGDNVVEARGTRRATTYTDTVVWTLSGGTTPN